MNNLYLSRDLLYLAFCCFGFCVACIVRIFAIQLSLKQRNRMISVAILWFSVVLAFLVPSIVFSNGEIFFYKSFYIVGIIVFVLALASWCFPKHFGLPLIVVAGFFVVIFAFLFLRFPLISEASFLASETGRLVSRVDNSNQIAVRILRSSGKDSSSEFALFEPQNWEDPLSILAYDFYIDEAVPFTGGQIRSTAAEIVQNGSIVFLNPMILRIPFQNFLKDENRKPFVLIKEYERNIRMEDL